MSEPPSHPELIDYLAMRFQDEGWSIKKIHRLIMLSSVYQQTTTDNPRYAQVDPYNRLLWRANIQRLEFESLRDSLLAIGGSLDPKLYGRPIDLERNLESTRRTIYGVVDRSDLLDAFVNFDFANPDMVNGKRYETSVPQQALFLMNSPVVIEQAKKLVALEEFAERTNDTARIEFLYERIYQRLPQPTEIQLGLDFVAQAPLVKKSVETIASTQTRPATRQERRQEIIQEKRAEKIGGKTPNNQPPKKRAPLTGWQEYAHALLQANELSFVN